MIKKFLLLTLVLALMQVEHTACAKKGKGNLDLKGYFYKIPWRDIFNAVKDSLEVMTNFLHVKSMLTDDDELDGCWENETVNNEKVFVCDYVNESTGLHTYVRTITDGGSNPYVDCVDRNVSKKRPKNLRCNDYRGW